MTHPSDIAGLSERLRDAAHDPTMGIAGYCLLVDEAAAALDSLTARVKELEAEQEKLIEGLPSPPSHLLFYGLADAFHLSIKIRYAAGGSINHEFSRNDIKEIRGALHPARGQIK